MINLKKEKPWFVLKCRKCKYIIDYEEYKLSIIPPKKCPRCGLKIFYGSLENLIIINY